MRNPHELINYKALDFSRIFCLQFAVKAHSLVWLLFIFKTDLSVTKAWCFIMKAYHFNGLYGKCFCRNSKLVIPQRRWAATRFEVAFCGDLP